MDWLKRLFSAPHAQTDRAGYTTGKCESCPRCGSGTLAMESTVELAAVQVNPRNRIDAQVTSTRVVCKSCGMTINDDCYGSVAEVYARLLQQAGKQPVPRFVGGGTAEIIAKARGLAQSTESQTNGDWHQVQESWSAVRVVKITSSSLEATIALLLYGNAQEAFFAVSSKVTSGMTLQIDCTNDFSAWRPYRIRRTSAEEFALYGHISMYRMIGKPCA